MPDERSATLEEVARGDIPPQYVTVLGTLVVGDNATVWMLTNDRPPYEPYTVGCHREHGHWVADAGICGLSDVIGMGFPPEAVIERADRYLAKPLCLGEGVRPVVGGSCLLHWDDSQTL